MNRGLFLALACFAVLLVVTSLLGLGLGFSLLVFAVTGLGVLAIWLSSGLPDPAPERVLESAGERVAS